MTSVSVWKGLSYGARPAGRRLFWRGAYQPCLLARCRHRVARAIARSIWRVTGDAVSGLSIPSFNPISPSASPAAVHSHSTGPGPTTHAKRQPHAKPSSQARLLDRSDRRRTCPFHLLHAAVVRSVVLSEHAWHRATRFLPVPNGITGSELRRWWRSSPDLTPLDRSPCRSGSSGALCRSSFLLGGGT